MESLEKTREMQSTYAHHDAKDYYGRASSRVSLHHRPHPGCVLLAIIGRRPPENRLRSQNYRYTRSGLIRDLLQGEKAPMEEGERGRDIWELCEGKKRWLRN
ncbi:hypothetical protein E2C01_081663 [Portunus trituberculatus]|uniref:Uncharacterized protein n=1 Tax=Portunus trituberculatus TaxID=210409 RepID=A0A5B7IZG3_PORTR|nr:hypothetical protein [Portunus trituberculatus]